jgi:DNA primase
MPVTWKEVASDELAIEDFRLDNIGAWLARRGDLWAPVVAPAGRVNLQSFLKTLR